MQQVDPFTRYIVLPNGCWEWQGAIGGGGYGYVKHQGRLWRAHRLFYVHHVGPIPDGLDLDHECHNIDASCAGGSECRHRRCVNPFDDHLIPRTKAENARRGRTGEAGTPHTHCGRGHPLTPDNVYTNGPGRRRCRRCTLDRNRRGSLR